MNVNFRPILLTFLLAPFLTALGQGGPTVLWSQQQNSDRINAVVFSPDASKFITGSSDRLINVWRASDGALLQVLNTNAAAVHESSIESLAISGDGTRLASASFRVVKLWRLSDGSVLNLPAGTNWNVGVSFSPGGAYVAGASFDNLVRIWRVSDGSLVTSLRGPSAEARCVAFSPDGNYVATGAGDGAVRIYRTTDWSLLRTMTGHTSDIYVMAFSPDSASLVTAGYDHTARVWNVSDGTLRFTAVGNGNVYAAGFSPDSSQLAFADGEANSLRLLRASDGAELRKYTDNVNNVQALQFSPAGGGVLGYGRADQTVVLSRVGTTVTPPVTNGPQVTLTSPGGGSSFEAPADVDITASATASTGIARIDFFANNNSIGSATLAPYSVHWSGVAAGSYTITAVATDNGGRHTTSSAVTVTVNSPAPGTSVLSVQVNGNGTVQPNRDGQTLQVGARYSMTAVPAAGNLFAGWTGGASSSAATLTFTMQDGMGLTANFLPNPFVPRVGTYRGIISGDPATFPSAGFFRVTTTSSGTFSGVFVLGMNSVSLSGRFLADGSFTRTISIPGRGAVNVALQLHVADSSEQITGTFSNDSFSAHLSGDRAVFGPGHPSPNAGRYTVIFPPSDDPAAPQGTGFAIVTIDGLGNVRVGASLADGIPFTEATTLSGQGTWALFGWLYGGRGSISGTMTLRNLAGTDMDGTVLWARPASSRYFPAGFSSSLSAAGSLYTAPGRGARVLDVPDAAANVVVSYSGGGNDGTLTEAGTLDTSGRLFLATPGSDNLRAAFAPATGAFGGAFINPANHRLTAFHGIVLQKQNIAAGYFLGTSDSGNITIR